MSEFLHSEAPCPAPIRAYGCRRVTLDMRARLDEADRFTGLPRGTAKPFEFLTAFEQAEPYLGLPAHAYKLIGFWSGGRSGRIGKKEAARLRGRQRSGRRNFSVSPCIA